MTFQDLSQALHPRLAWEAVQRLRFRRVARREEQGCTGQWYLLFDFADKAALLHPQPAGMQKLIPPNDRVWADPFAWKQGSDYFIFCEEWIYSQPHGHLSVIRLGADGRVKEPATPVIQEPSHLSYPFLFEFEGQLYMLPENSAAGQLQLYRCEEFPHRWVKANVLMENVRAADTVMLQHQGKWWMFTSLDDGNCRSNRDLCIFWADSPLSNRWTPHPRNPVIRSFKKARGAGRIFTLEGKLYRPSQNCLVRYGYGLNVSEITQLDPQHYSERAVCEVTSEWEEGNRATHHIDWHEGLLCLDARRLLSPEQVIL